MDDEMGCLAAVVILSLILGCGLLYFVTAPLFDTDAPTEAQTLSVSTTLTNDNCDAAAAVGDGACNAKVTILPNEYWAGLGIAVFMIVAAILIIAMIFALGA